MIAAMDRPRANGAKQQEFDIDFHASLPPQDFFPVWQLARIWKAHRQHVINLIESGELKVPVDLRNKASSRSMIRVPRASVVEFLNRRKVRP
jgi:hypothetical protein